MYFQEIEIIEKILGKTHPLLASAYSNLATLYLKMGDYEKALPLYIKAKNIREKAFGQVHPAYANSLNNLASSYKQMGKDEEALSLFNQSKDIFEKIYGKMHPEFAGSLSNLASAHYKMGNTDKAWINILQAVESYSGAHLSRGISPQWADTLLNASFPSNLHVLKMVGVLNLIFFLLEEERDASNKQIILTNLVADLLAKHRNDVSNDKDKLRGLFLSSQWLRKSLTCLHSPVYNKKAFALADQNKSVLLLQASKSEQAYRLGNLSDALVLVDKKNIRKQSQLQAKLAEDRAPKEKDSLLHELNHLNQEIDEFLQLIKNKYPKYHKLKYQQIDAKVEDIQALLDDKTALLEYVVGDSMVHVFCVDKQQVLWKKMVVSNKELKQRIERLHKALSNYETVVEDKKLAYEEYVEQAYWFYQNLVEPVLKDKKHIQSLILVTDRALGFLPFETFLVEQAPQKMTDYGQLHYLVTDYNISYNYSATLWKENMESPAPKNNGQILGLAANYAIQLDSSMLEVRLPTDQWLRERLVPLPNARKEVESLQENYQGFFAFDSLASEKMVKEKASDFAILHFATHGILDTKRPMLSSLAFSEDSDSIESNFWQAHEISKIELNANLVVLSACETGYGRFETGNGIASLARAFMYAGASSLIVSLWQVNDYATSEIMKKLYANLAEGMKIDEALRQAKLQYMKTAKGVLAHPAFWSPFIQMGNTRPVSVKRKGNTTMPWRWMIGGASVFLLLGTFVLSRRKKEVV